MPVLDGQEIQNINQMIDALEKKPALGRLTLKAEAEWTPDGFESRVVLNPTLKGSGGEPMYAEELLDVLAKCLAHDTLGHSGLHGIRIDGLLVQVEGDIDFAGSVGLDAPAAFTDLRISIQADTDAEAADLERLREAVHRVSIVAQSLRRVPQKLSLVAKKNAVA